MTRDQLTDVSITTAEEFEATLAEAIERAMESDVQIRGAWEFRTSGSAEDWEVEIFELARERDDTDD